MKKFKFRLERVLQYRRVIKNDSLRVLMECRREVERLREQIGSLERELLAQHPTEGAHVSASALVMVAHYVVRIRTEIAKTFQELELAEERYQKALATYIEAAKDEKSLVTLKDKKQVEYRELTDKSLQAALDERATIVAGRVKGNQ